MAVVTPSLSFSIKPLLQVDRPAPSGDGLRSYYITKVQYLPLIPCTLLISTCPPSPACSCISLPLVSP